MFKVTGVSTQDGLTKVRFANDFVSRVKMLIKAGHTDIELMELPEDTELDGYLSVTLKVDNPLIERITCGDCGYKDYLIVPSDH